MPLKRGIHRLDQLRRVRERPTRSRKIDLGLYLEILRGDGRDDEWLATILRILRTGSGACKRVERRRFDPIDAQVVEHARALVADGTRQLTLHDLGVSDGQSTVDLHRAIAAVAEVDTTASDASGNASKFARQRSKLRSCQR